jgi:hypothetical protein
MNEEGGKVGGDDGREEEEIMCGGGRWIRMAGVGGLLFKFRRREKLAVAHGAWCATANFSQFRTFFYNLKKLCFLFLFLF